MAKIVNAEFPSPFKNPRIPKSTKMAHGREDPLGSRANNQTYTIIPISFSALYYLRKRSWGNQR